MAASKKSAVARAVGLPPRAMWPWALPGAARVHEARWAAMLRTRPVVTVEEHAGTTGVKDIEEVIGCSLCGDRRVQALFNPRSHKAGRWSYEVVRCAGCGFLYRSPGIRPERLGELYEGKYDTFLTGHYSDERSRRYDLVMQAFSPLLDEGRGRRLLDFGCGAGQFLELAHERGFDVYGVDLSEAAVEVARGRPSGRNAYFGAPEDVPEIAAGGFDVITLWSVLAHLPCPVEDFTAFRGLLKPDGVLVVLTVNANSLALKAHRDGWNGFTPNHLKFYSPTTLPVRARRAGFAAVETRPAYGDTVEAGTTRLRARQVRRLKRNVDRGNQGNMLRAVLYAGGARQGSGRS